MALQWKPVDWEMVEDVTRVIELAALLPGGSGVARVRRLPSERWHASVRDLWGAYECLGDNFPNPVAAARACDEYAGAEER